MKSRGFHLTLDHKAGPPIAYPASKAMAEATQSNAGDRSGVLNAVGLTSQLEGNSYALSHATTKGLLLGPCRSMARTSNSGAARSCAATRNRCPHQPIITTHALMPAAHANLCTCRATRCHCASIGTNLPCNPPLKWNSDRSWVADRHAHRPPPTSASTHDGNPW